MNVFPLGARVLVAEESATKVTSLGIIIEGSAGDAKVFRVIEKGPDVWRGIELNQRVLLEPGKGQIVMIDNKQRILISVDGISAIVTD
jgi:co-chaperonin GroES (HSP10)